MGPPLQFPEHRKRIVGVRGLLQQIIAQQHDGVGTQDEVPLHAACLVPRQPFRILHRSFPRGSLLFDVRRPDLDRNAEHLEQLSAARGRRGENEWVRHDDRIAVVGSGWWGVGPYYPPPTPHNQSRIPLKNQGYRSIVVDLDLHHRPELSGLYLESLGAQGRDEAFVEWDRDLGPGGVDE